jgi:hypothetical protein
LKLALRFNEGLTIEMHSRRDIGDVDSKEMCTVSFERVRKRWRVQHGLSSWRPGSGCSERGYSQDRSIEHKGEVLKPFSGQILCIHHHLRWIDLDR